MEGDNNICIHPLARDSPMMRNVLTFFPNEVKQPKKEKSFFSSLEGSEQFWKIPEHLALCSAQSSSGTMNVLTGSIYPAGMQLSALR